MTTAGRVELEAQAEHARQRLLGALQQLDARAKSLKRSAVEVTQISGWGIAGALALWAGVALLTRKRERTHSALVYRPRPSLLRRVAVGALRAGAAIAGFFASRAWAQHFLATRRLGHEGSSATPHMRQLGAGSQPLLAADLSHARGTSDA